MRAATFAAHLLRRKPGAELWLFLACQVFAVMVVSGTLLFTERIERAIYRENASLMAADLLLDSSRPLDQATLRSWRQRAAALELVDAQAVELDSMLFHGGQLQLTEVTAVSPGYPLRGTLTVAAGLAQLPEAAATLPAPGEIWLDTRTAQALQAAPGDYVELGASELLFTRVLHQQPGLALPGIGLAGRALIAMAQLEPTQLLQPGSRASYRWLLAGDAANVATMGNWLEPRLQPQQRLVSSQQGGENTARALQRMQGFLNLSGATSLLLALVATLITAYKYLEREQPRVATWKALGFSRRLLLRAYALQFALWWLCASVIGCVLGVALQSLAFYVLRNWFQVTSVYPLQPFLMAMLTALVCLLCFAMPVLRGFGKVSPMQLLRNVHTVVISPWAIAWLLPALALLLNMFSRSWGATAMLLAGLVILGTGCWLAIGGAIWLLQKLLLKRGAATTPHPGSSAPLIELGLHAFCRQRRASQLRATALAVTLAMLVVVLGLRGGLLDAWRAQIPANAPNYFAVNISAGERETWQQSLGRAGVTSQGLFAVARARLVAINGEPAEQLFASNATARRALSREMVMTQALRLPLGNTIEQGRWHGNASGSGSRAEVSVERGIADRLKLELGDWLQFSFADRALDVRVTSIRALDWNSMQPNFYFILAPPLLEAYPYTFITSFYLPAQNAGPVATEARTNFLLQLGRAFPAVALIDIGALVAQLQRVLDRVGLAVQGLALLNVAAALLVLVASLRASLQQRLREQTILRALGGRAGQLRRIAQVELGVSGLLAGVVGCGLGGLLVALLGEQLFAMSILPAPALLLAVTLGSCLLVIVLGTLVLGSVYRASPLRAWRSA